MTVLHVNESMRNVRLQGQVHAYHFEPTLEAETATKAGWSKKVYVRHPIEKDDSPLQERSLMNESSHASQLLAITVTFLKIMAV
jgi:hypothetical protein